LILLYTALAAEKTVPKDESLKTGEAITTVLLLAVGSDGIIVNDVHNNPRNIGINKFFTLGTGFLRSNLWLDITPSVGFKNVRQC